MVERLVDETGPAVQFSKTAMTKGEKTRAKIMDIAYEAIVQKGFGATSIDELVAQAGITKSGFFYHFKDKNDLARQLFDRFLDEDLEIFDTLEARARSLSDDPLQSFLIFLNLYAQLMDDMDDLHPGCMVAAVTYQERLFDDAVRQMNADFLNGMRVRFKQWIDEITDKYEPREPVDGNDLADQLTAIVEGSIILSKAMRDKALMGRQTRLFRQYVKLLFDA